MLSDLCGIPWREAVPGEWTLTLLSGGSTKSWVWPAEAFDADTSLGFAAS